MIFGVAAAAFIVPTAAVIGSVVIVYSAYQLCTHLDSRYNQVELDQQENVEAKQKKEKKKSSNVYAPDRPLPCDDKHHRPLPARNAEGLHTQLGTKDGRKGKYPQAREFDKDGKPVRDIDFTDHGYPEEHSNPHQHLWIENQTGGTPKRDDAQALEDWIYTQ